MPQLGIESSAHPKDVRNAPTPPTMVVPPTGQDTPSTLVGHTVAGPYRTVPVLAPLVPRDAQHLTAIEGALRRLHQE